MSLRFILGRAGAGKTERCRQELLDELAAGRGSHPLIWLVPEQATFLTERLLLAKVPGLIRGEVLSFRRLAWRILAQLGGALRPELNELGRYMALQAILSQRAKELQLFRSSWSNPGFVRQLAATLAELGRHAITPEDLQTRAQALPAEHGLLGRKLADLSLVYAAYTQYLQGRYTDPEGVLALATRQLEGSSYLEGSEIWVDGFSGFNPQEYQLLGALMSRARQLTVALCLDPLELSHPVEEGDLFHPTLTTQQRLRHLARERRVGEVRSLQLAESLPRFRQSGALAHLERNLFGPALPSPQPVDAHELRLVAASDRRAEVEAAGRQLLSLARDQGYRWRDMAVILRQTQPYADLIAAIFHQLDIPHFIDERRTLTHHPLVELVRALGELAGGSWTYEAVFRALKTDFFDLSRDEVDQLENYVLAHGIQGDRWWDAAPWRYFPRFSLEQAAAPSRADERLLAQINDLRHRVVAQLMPFCRSVRQDKPSVRWVVTRLWELLEQLGVGQRLATWREAARAAGQPQEAEEHEGAYAAVTSLLDQLVEALGDQHVPWAELRRILEAGLESLNLGMVPPALDQVMVGTIERSRHPQLRAALILGMSEGLFPWRHAEDPVLGDSDRLALDAQGLELGPTARQQQLDEAYLAYIACTRADCRLYVSYPLMDEAGRALLPSPYVDRLRRLFPSLGVSLVPPGPGEGPAGELAQLAGSATAASFLAGRLSQVTQLGQLGPIWRHTYNWLLEQPQGRRQLATLLSGLQQDQVVPPLAREWVERLYGNPLVASVSRMERFAACPLWHYLSYGLRLKKRQVQTVAAPEVGSFMHACLSQFVRRLGLAQRSWSQLQPEEAQELMSQVVAELLPRLQGEALLGGEQQRFLARALERALVEAAQIIAEQTRQGQFVTVASEVNFGYPGGIPPLCVPLAGEWQLQLRGQIDRVDAAPSPPGGALLRVIDYKRSGRDLDLVDLFHGLSLQLPLYLAVVAEYAQELLGEAARPVGLFYQGLYRPLYNSDGPLTPDEAAVHARRAYRLQGWLLADDEAMALTDQGLPRPGFASQVVPVKMNKDGTPARHARVVDAQRLELLQSFARHCLGQLGRRLVAGEVRPYPYRRGRKRACQWCDYHAACGFDVRFASHRYRPIHGWEQDELWARMAYAVEGAAQDDHNLE